MATLNLHCYFFSRYFLTTSLASLNIAKKLAQIPANRSEMSFSATAAATLSFPPIKRVLAYYISLGVVNFETLKHTKNHYLLEFKG